MSMLHIILINSNIAFAILHETGALSIALSILPLALIQVSIVEVAPSLTVTFVVDPISNVFVVPLIISVTRQESAIAFSQPMPRRIDSLALFHAILVFITTFNLSLCHVCQITFVYVAIWIVDYNLICHVSIGVHLTV